MLVGVAAAVLGGGVAAAVVFGGLSGGQAATGGQVPPNQAYVAPPATATVQIPPGGFTAATGRPAAPPQAARKRPPAPRAPIAVQAVTTAAFGPVLAADGRTLYRLTPRTHQLTCVGACPAGWRALLLAPGQAVQLAPDLIGQVGTITLPNGSTQVTYNGVPLYLFTGDQAEGEANGAGGRWEVVRPR